MADGNWCIGPTCGVSGGGGNFPYELPPYQEPNWGKVGEDWARMEAQIKAQPRISNLSQSLRWNSENMMVQSREINALRQMRNMFQGPGDWISLWLLDRRIDTLSSSYSSDAHASSEMYREIQALEKGEAWPGESAPGEPEVVIEPKMSDKLPIPDWLADYLERSSPVSQEGDRKLRRGEMRTKGFTGGREGFADWAAQGKGSFALKPMGAQGEMGPEQQAQMRGYLGWTKAGSPTSLGQQGFEQYLKKLEQLPGWWNEYMTRSKELFPSKVTQRANWTPRAQ